MRIYSSYSQAEMDAVEAEAKKYGMSLSAFQRYATLMMLKLPAGTQNMATLTAVCCQLAAPGGSLGKSE